MATGGEQYDMTDRLDGKKSLKLSDVEKGLSSLWLGAASETPQTEAPAEIKVCTLTLVVNVPDDASLDAVFDAVRVASQEHPLRAIFMRLEPESPDAVPEAQVSGYCQITPSGNVQVCCEQVVVTARGKSVHELAPAISNLLAPDLPVVLWWMGQPAFDMPLFQRLESVSDYLLVDSRDFSDPVTQITRLAANMDKHSLVAPSDLNWLRITDWREATAGLFESADLRPCLNQLTNIEVRYSSGNPAQAILFAGWLSSRMRWTPEGITGKESAGRIQCTARSARGDQILIAFAPEDCEQAGTGNLLAVSLDAQSEHCTFSLTSAAGQIHAQALRDAKVVQEANHSLSFSSCTMTQLLLHELVALWPDPIYHEALLAGAHLLASGEP
jgi:glucose-6-phosphate dehydrogenase assembly protein OpcA